jgi:hypothetical protein
METLKNKNIILISPSFFGYEKEVYLKLKSFGANVFYIDDRWSNNAFVKAYIRLGIKNFIINFLNKKYFQKKIRESNFKNIDFFLVISPEGFTKRELLELKQKYINAEFILYMFDSFANKKNALESMNYYSQKFTFDYKDAQHYKINFLPTFYIDLYKTIQLKKEYKYKLCFLGTAHSDRYTVVNKILNQCKGYSNFTFFYLQNKLLFLFLKITNKDFKKIDQTDVSYQPFNKNQIVNIVENSEIVIDVHHPNQAGLTLRPFEMLAAQRKIITTNEHILDYDFYNTKNILVVDRYNPIIPITFLNSKYEKVSDYIYNKYSLESWLKTIFINL